MRQTVCVSKAHNYIVVSDYHSDFKSKVVDPFCRRHLYKTERVPIPGTRDAQYRISHKFIRYNADKTEFRICRSLLKPLIDFAQQQNYHQKRIKIVDLPELSGVSCHFEFNKGWGEPREHQIPWLKYQLEPGALKINNMTPGGGKEQPLDALIKIPGGWKRMGDMRVGDIISAWDGRPSKVLGVFPQGKKDVYRIHFEDGRTSDCGLDHLWRIYYRGFPDVVEGVSYQKCTNSNNQYKTLTTREILKLMENKDAARRLYVPLCQSEEIPDADLAIDPYVMGCLLGDGNYSATAVSITKPYQQLFDNIQSRLPDHLECSWYEHSGNPPKTFGIRFKEGYEKSNPDLKTMQEHLRIFGLMGTRCWEKTIPEEYLHGSTKQRLELLQGLMDTDGTCSATGEHVKSNGKSCVRQGGSPSYSTTSKVLSEQVQYLVRSLGGIAKISTRIPHFTYKGERKAGRTDYRVHIRYPRPEELFTLDHKKSRAVRNQYSDTLKLRISHIEKIEAVEQQCIMIDHPDHLYVTNDFVVTHNTFCALSLMIAMGVRTVITIAPRYIPVWIKALGDIVNLQPRDVILIEGDLIEAAQHIRDGIINPKVIILPLTKLEVFLRKTEETPCGVDLDDIYKWMGAGLRIQDEAHEAIHQVYLSMLYGNFKKTLALSGTLESDDPFTNKIYKLLYPKQFYLQATEYKKYLNIIAYHYYMDTYKHKLKTQSFGGYSDTAYEKSILKSNKLFEFYYQLTKKAFDDYYIKRRREKSKCLIFFSKVDMCERMQARFKRDYPDMDIISFTGTETKKAATKDKYLKHEIVISTPGSCGTGKDIKGLITCICMHTVSSMQRNDQILMRLRELFDIFPDMDPLFVYGVNWSIAKHRDYHYKRKELFEPKSKGQYLINSQMYI